MPGWQLHPALCQSRSSPCQGAGVLSFFLERNHRWSSHLGLHCSEVSIWALQAFQAAYTGPALRLQGSTLALCSLRRPGSTQKLVRFFFSDLIYLYFMCISVLPP